MSEKQLNVGEKLSMPLSVSARTVFIAGTKGSGKTYSAGVMAEEMLSAGMHLVILDPLGVWWGLRHDASGGDGGFPIVILGGEHADAPLLPSSGEAVAEYIVRSGQSVILDLSGFAANAEQDRFVTDLLHKLFRLKAAEKSSLHLIIDEADMFVPQQAISKTEIPLLGAAKTIVTKGRSRGLSMTMITQRPQSIAKAAIEEADVLLCHRMQGVRAVKAMREWTDLYATAEQARVFFDSLPLLDDGQCWVWSPQFLKTFERVRFRAKKTFDSSRTPDPGQRIRKAGHAAKVDLDKLTAEIKATAEQAKANDPRELRRQIAELHRQIKTLETAPPKAAAEKPARKIEIPVLKDSQIAAIDKLAERLDESLASAARLLEGINQRAKLAREIADKIGESANAIGNAVKLAKAPAAQVSRPAASPSPLARPHVPARPAITASPGVVFSAAGTGLRDVRINGDHVVLPPGERAILTACAQHPGGVTREQLTILSGYKKSSRDKFLQRLRQRGYVNGDGSEIIATDLGVAALGEDFEALPTGDALRAYWLRRLPEGERRTFESVAAAFPDALEREALSEQTGFKKSSRDKHLQRLAARKLIEPAGAGFVRASAMLFG